MAIYELDKRKPSVEKANFIADNASIIGNVHLDNHTSVWFGAVLRADNDHIKIGEETNIQDNAVLHVDPGCPIEIGARCVIGHNAILHGAKLGDQVLIGMNATVLNNVEIGNNSIVGANSLLTSGKIFPKNSLIMGSPARVIRELNEQEIDSIKQNAKIYASKSETYRNLLHMI